MAITGRLFIDAGNGEFGEALLDSDWGFALHFDEDSCEANQLKKIKIATEIGCKIWEGQFSLPYACVCSSLFMLAKEISLWH